MTRRWRWALWLAGIPLALLVVLAVTLAGLLGTERGSRWLLSQVPGLAVQGFTGALGAQWQASQVTWQGDDGLEVSLDAPRFAWSPSCLWRLTVCVNQLQAQRVSVIPGNAPAAPEDTGPLKLPNLRLPLGLKLGAVDVAQVYYAGDLVLSGLHLAAGWDLAGLRLDSLELTQGDLRLALEGTLRPEGNWPLDTRLRVALPSVDGKPWEVVGSLTGDLAGQLSLAARSSGYLDAALTGTVQALAEHVPASVSISADSFVARQSLPATLTLQGLTLHADGDLENGYAIVGDASLPGEQGAVALRLRGQAGANGARVDELSFSTDPAHRANVMGSLDWTTGMAGEAHLDWQDFPWTSLYPQPAPPPVLARSMTAMVRYGNGHYLGNLAGEFQGPAGPFTAATPFSGDNRQLVLPQLDIKAGAGQLAGQVKLGFEQGVSWAANLSLANLDPSYWIAALPGKLQGTVASEGAWRDNALELEARLGISGRLRGQPAKLAGVVEGRGKQWRASGLDLALGANHLAGGGTSEDKLDGKLTLDAPRLDQLWPGLSGALNGRLALAGSLSSPQGQLVLNGRQVAFQGNRLGVLAAEARLDARQQATLAIKASGLSSGDTSLGTLTLSGNGTAQRHMLVASLTGPTLALELGADGSWLQGAWKGRLTKGRVAGRGQAWALGSPATVQRLADGTVTLGAHCWRSGPASLCADDQRLAPDPRIRLRLRDFQMASLQPWLPQGLSWEGRASADVQVDLGGAGPRGQLALDVSGGTVQVQQGDQRLRFPYGTLRLASKMAPGQVDTELAFDGQKLGQLNVQARLDPFGPAKPLQGSFRFDGLDLAVFGPLVKQVERLAGRLQGSGQLGGSLLEPRLDGAFTLVDGAVSGPSLPLSVEALALQARMSGEHVQLTGSFRSGAQGQGSLNGELDWSSALRLDMTLQASRLPIVVPPYADVEAGADLRLALVDQKLALSGKVSVPKGTITVRQLPPSTVKVSDDAVVVGREAPARAQTGIAMDVNVDVGQDKLSFSAFGLQSDIVGRLHIGDNLDTRGSLELRNGRYRAYGQRLTLRRARLFFTGPVDQPYLDVEAIRQTDDVTAGIRLSGSVQQPTSEVFAEPAMSQEQALSWLILGRPLGNNGEDNNVLAQAALGLGLMGGASTAGQLAHSLGIQDFQLDTEGSGDATSVVASGNLTDRLTLRYGVGVFEPASTVALRYALTRQLYLEVAGGVASSLDLFYKKDF